MDELQVEWDTHEVYTVGFLAARFRKGHGFRLVMESPE